MRIGAGGSPVKGKKAAGILFTDGTKILLLKRSNEGDHGNTWSLPGGKGKDGETEIGNAIRETKEETGLDNLKIKPGFEHNYSYTFSDFKGNKVQKTVVFFIGHSLGNQTVRLSHEHMDFLWLPYEQARMQIYFESVRLLLDEVESFLDKKYSK